MQRKAGIAVTQHKQRRPWQLDREGSIDTDVWELFNLEEDFSQSTTIADQNPEKLDELKARAYTSPIWYTP